MKKLAPKTYCQMFHDKEPCAAWGTSRWYGVFLHKSFRLIAKFKVRKEALDYRDLMNGVQNGKR